jgi:hypothetical protein
VTPDDLGDAVGRANLETSILRTLVYADLFDYPLTAREIHRYLVGYAASPESVEDALFRPGLLRERTDEATPLWFLSGRSQIVEVRREREAQSHALWPWAWRYGRQIATRPFIRLVAVTGSLAVNNVSHSRDDIDLLLVARTGRVWLARALTLLSVHLAYRLGITLCPNYVLSEDHLRLEEANFFTAHELAQVVPLYGLGVYRSLFDHNSWITHYLPNAAPRNGAEEGAWRETRVGQRVLEVALGGPIGETLERWERQRKIDRLRREAAQRGGLESQFSADLCKGHIDSHAAVISQRYAERLKEYGI